MNKTFSLLLGLAVAGAVVTPAAAAPPSLEVKVTNVQKDKFASGRNGCYADFLTTNKIGKSIEFRARISLYDQAGSKLVEYVAGHLGYVSNGETARDNSYLENVACERVASWKIDRFEWCEVSGTGKVDPQSCYKLLKATSGSTAAEPLPSLQAPSKKDDAATAKVKRTSGTGKTVPKGNYKCFSSMKANSWVLMGNVEILSGDTFRIGNSQKYSYSFDAATGKITWHDGMHKGDDSFLQLTKDGTPEIKIQKKAWPRPTWYCKHE